MKFEVFSIRDLNSGFNQPFCETNERVAKRSFAYAVNNSDLPGFAPGDFDLYRLGWFDTDNGSITPFDVPELIVHGTEVFHE